MFGEPAGDPLDLVDVAGGGESPAMDHFLCGLVCGGCRRQQLVHRLASQLERRIIEHRVEQFLRLVRLPLFEPGIGEAAGSGRADPVAGDGGESFRGQRLAGAVGRPFQAAAEPVRAPRRRLAQGLEAGNDPCGRDRGDRVGLGSETGLALDAADPGEIGRDGDGLRFGLRRL